MYCRQPGLDFTQDVDDVLTEGSINSEASGSPSVKFAGKFAEESDPPSGKKLKTGKLPAAVQLCIMGDGKPRYCRMRFCKEHKAVMDIVYWQADNPHDGEEAVGKQVREAMEDDAVAMDVIAQYEKTMPADASLGKRKKKGAAPRFVHSAQVRKRWGVKVTQRSVEEEKPTEEIEFIATQERKGWPKAEAKAEWKHLVSRAEVADYKGLRGAARYWIEQDSKRQRIVDKFCDTGVDQTGDQIKNIKGQQLDALKIQPCFSGRPQ